MATIAIVASGSRGDVQPYLGLAQGLQSAGHTVRFVTGDDFRALVTGAGLSFYPMGASIGDRLQSDEWRSTIEGGNFITILGKMQSEMKGQADKIAQQLPALLNGSDLIVTGAAALGGTYSIAQKLGIPLVQAYVFPFMPTVEFPSPLVPTLPVGGIVNRLSFQITRQMFWQMSKVGDVATRKVLGMGGAPMFGHYGALDNTDAPILYGYSRHVLPRPRDWAENVHITGYWFADEDEGWTPPAELVDFLNAGEAPVYIGFGSMNSRDPEATAAIALEALRLAGKRGIVASGWGGMNAKQLPDTVHQIGSIPHSWLFTRMAAVVHHGGAGTTAAGLRAGVPSVIVPFFGDQPFWGHRVAALGVGTPPIPRKQLTAERLAAAIRSTSDSAMREKAQALGKAIAAEDGNGNAVRLIEGYVAKS
jgi:sterol 3beta-glucosyltransferase